MGGDISIEFKRDRMTPREHLVLVFGSQMKQNALRDTLEKNG